MISIPTRQAIETLLGASRDPQSLLDLSLADWDALLPLARQLGVLGRFKSWLDAGGAWERIPPAVRGHLEAAAVVAGEHERRLRWEVNRIQRALSATDVTIILLKGAAYVLAGLPCAKGRLASDVDILVRRDDLAVTEQALLAHDWEAMIDDAYDQSYYRRWMHELPPLRHRLRGTIVDVHHTVLPPTHRLRPDPALLLAAAETVGERLAVLAPPDMVLHSATHAFADGDLAEGWRDLLDLHDLFRHFGARPGFWEELPARARQLQLQRPLFYALRYCRRFMATAIPDQALAALDAARPPRAVLALMDGLVRRSLYAGPSPSYARRLLYLRSHWLRMPPALLARHLLRKSVKRLGT